MHYALPPCSAHQRHWPSFCSVKCRPGCLPSLLYLGSGLGLSLVRLFQGDRGQHETQLTKRDLPWLAGTVFFGGVVGPALLMWGLLTSDAVTASLLLNMEAVFTLGLAWLVFHEHVDRKLFIGAAAIVAGAVLLSSQGNAGFDVSPQYGLGMALIILACLSWAIDNNLTRKIASVDPVQLASIKGLVAGSVNAALAFAMGETFPSMTAILSAMALGFVSYGLGLVLFIFALRELGTARTGAYYGTAPFIGAVLAVVLFSIPLTPVLVLSGILMAIGAWLHLSEQHTHEHSHTEMEHDHRHVHDEHHQHSHGEGVATTEPHAHFHRHPAMSHAHRHWPDSHHRHRHSS